MNEEVKQSLRIIRNDLENSEYDYSHEIRVIETALNKAEDYEIQNILLKEHEKELIAEQHRLFDLAKEQETELKELREFAKIVSQFDVWTWTYPRGSAIEIQQTKISKKNLLLFKKVVEKYGKINN